jgi:REP element-mobilizing transposase RayT
VNLLAKVSFFFALPYQFHDQQKNDYDNWQNEWIAIAICSEMSGYYLMVSNESAMANTYTQIHIQVIFAVKSRAGLILPLWKEPLYRYISGIVANNGHKLLAINGIPDHVHLFFGMRPTQSLSDLMRMVKGNSSEWINEQGFVKGKFAWQEGYGAFSYSRSHVSNVIRYIQRQEMHHRKVAFLDEYKQLLDAFEVPYEERYLFKPVE